MDDGDQAFEALKQGLMADYSDHGIATLQYVEDDANVALIDSDMDDPGQQILVEYSSAIADLVAAEQQLLTSDTHGFFNQDRAIRSGNQSLGDQFIGTDDNNRRGILNTLNVGMYKDHLRILQEKMRTVYVISSIVSDAIATIAANVGDMEKVNVANGLKRIFESRFSIINMTMDLQEQLLKQYETMVGHNFSVDKMRYDRTVGLGVSSATVLTLGLMPVYGQPIKMAMDSSVNIGLYDQSPYSDKHLHSMNDNMQHLKEMARERYSLSSPDDQAAMDRLNWSYFDQSMLTMYRSKSFDVMKEAASIQPVDTGGRLSLLNGFGVTTQAVDYASFNQCRNQIVNFGLNVQQWLMYFSALTSHLGALTKAIRGDGKIGGHHISMITDMIEREVSHDLDEIDRIQGMQQQFISLNNQHYESLKSVEKSAYELLFVGGYFIAGILTQSVSVLGVLIMKTFSNLVQGIVLGYVNQNEYTKEYQRHLKSVKSQFSDEDVFDQLSQDDPYGHVSSAHVNTYQYEEKLFVFAQQGFDTYLQK